MIRKCQGHLWLLTGTGEGPIFVGSLLSKGWSVTVSVVSEKAGNAYSQLPLESLMVGSLNGSLDIKRVLNNANIKHNGFDWVIDLTHPFATLITSSLEKVCLEVDQPLLRYERPIKKRSDVFLLQDLDQLAEYDLNGQSILIALGSRNLSSALSSIKESGAKAYARILPTAESLRKALACPIPESNLAPLNPFRGLLESYDYEAALCRRWSIDNVLCRQSGGLIESFWYKLCKDQGINLWMLSRPALSKELKIFNSLEEILQYLEK